MEVGREGQDPPLQGLVGEFDSAGVWLCVVHLKLTLDFTSLLMFNYN